MIELTRDQVLKCLDAGIWCYLFHWKDHRPFPVVTELWNHQHMGVWYGPVRRGQTKAHRLVLDFGRYGIDWRLSVPSLQGTGLTDWSFLHEHSAKETVPLLSFRTNRFPGCDDQWCRVYFNQLSKVQKELRPIYLSKLCPKGVRR